MKHRSLSLLLPLLPALLLATSGCTPAKTACPAVGFVNLDAVQLDLSGVPGVLAVS